MSAIRYGGMAVVADIAGNELRKDVVGALAQAGVGLPVGAQAGSFGQLPGGRVSGRQRVVECPEVPQRIES